jgi:hypothetical protein
MDKQWGDTKINGCLKDRDKSASGIDHSSTVLSQALRQDIQTGLLCMHGSTQPHQHTIAKEALDLRG